jgi:flagellar hook-associated protein 2
MASTNATSFSYLSTTGSRFTGLASGMDIESIVEKLMKAESAKMEKLQQQKQKYEWQRDSYRSINTKLEAFRTEGFDKYLSTSFNTKSATVSDSSKISVKASSDATASLSISSVSQLAQSANKVSTLPLASGSTVQGTNTLSDLGITGDGAVTVNVIQKDGTLKETTINYKSTDTLDSFIKNINASGAGLTAIFSDGKMSLTTNATGHKDNVSMEVVSDTGTDKVFKTLGFTGGDTGTIQVGQNAKYVVNGIEKEISRNTFTDFGYSITLNQTFNETNATNYTGAVTISASTNTDAIVDKVKSFVELYNGLIESMNSPIKEKKDYNYQPLTEAQKSAMSEDEIKKWEEKSKKGILRNDTAVSSVVSNMRSIIYSVSTDKDSKYNALFNIGITTSKEYNEGGKLVIDEDKLRKAIEANPEAVSDLFTRAEGVNGSTDKGGLITQLRAVAKKGIDSISAKAGKEGAVENTYTLGKTIKSVDDRITEWKDKLKSIEERYFKQFAAMESAIQKANSQSSMFMQG